MTRSSASTAVGVTLVMVAMLGAARAAVAADETPNETPAAAVATTSRALEDIAPVIMERVEQVRGLSPLATVPVRAVRADQSASENLEALEPEDRQQLMAEELLLKRIGLIPQDLDLLEAVEALFRVGLAGYYRPEHGDVAILDDDGLIDAIGQWTLAHEYVHALQDQHFDIETTLKDRPSGDAQTAVAALVEGDATLLMTALALSDALEGAPGLTPVDQTGLSSDAALLESLPRSLTRELLFPYIDGMAFAQRMWGRGGWDRLDEVWRDPPRSTEQIMHPERYPADEPVEVPLPDMADLLGEGWSVRHETTMGELRLSILVAGNQEYAIPVISLVGITLPNAEAAAGWGGDRVVTLDGPDDTWVVVWQTTWDTPTDAIEFAAAARGTMAGLSPVSSVVAATDISGAGPADRGVLLLVADSDATLSRLQAALATD